MYTIFDFLSSCFSKIQEKYFSKTSAENGNRPISAVVCIYNLFFRSFCIIIGSLCSAVWSVSGNRAVFTVFSFRWYVVFVAVNNTPSTVVNHLAVVLNIYRALHLQFVPDNTCPHSSQEDIFYSAL